MKKSLFTILFLGLGLAATAQNVVNGTVTDKQGNPIPGARVATTKGTESALTELDGTFRLETQRPAKRIAVDYVGLRSKQVRTRNDDMTIVLSPSNWFFDHYESEMNIGYGGGGKTETEGMTFGRIFAETVQGLRINKYAYTGIGIGFQYSYGLDVAFLPIFVDLKGYYPLNQKIAPYIAVDLGYALGLTREDSDMSGFYTTIGAGCNYLKWNFGLGYQYQSFIWGEAMNSFYVKVGMKF